MQLLSIFKPSIDKQTMLLTFSGKRPFRWFQMPLYPHC